ncbi:hypothetical protein ACGF07_03305 [Kitasatospora sp. NPDC048194]|uniref:hypothetical protein n=1 Tax=Kitasatospora sp. NPDC048194 TaxID=3364045 RepID=UPI00371344C5
MSEPMETGTEEPQQSAGRTRTGLGRAGRWVRRRSKRWVVVGAAAVVLGGAAAAVAMHHEHEGHGDGRRWAAGDQDRFDGQERGHGQERGDGQGAGEGQGRDGGRQRHGGRHEQQGPQGRSDDSEQARTGQDAPAPLPATDAADAVAKAAAAVSGGKVQSLTPVAEQGGGRAWRAVVVGPDGVRHAVTVDGANGTVTGNTVLGG